MEIQNAPYPCSDLEWHLEDEIAEPQNLSQAQVFQHCVSLNIWFLLHNFSFVHICVSTVHHNITFYGLEYFQYVKCRTNRKLSNDKDMVETDIEEVEPGAVFEDKKVQNSRSCRPSLITRHYILDIIATSCFLWQRTEGWRERRKIRRGTNLLSLLLEAAPTILSHHCEWVNALDSAQLWKTLRQLSYFSYFHFFINKVLCWFGWLMSIMYMCV